MLPRIIICLTVVTALSGAMMDLAIAGEPLAGEKLDNDLGGLPAYREWHRLPHLAGIAEREAIQTPAAKLDSGLGSLPPYTEWHRHPELASVLGKSRAESASASGR
jgi:hypothetical protein